MAPETSDKAKEWFVRNRWGLVPLLTGLVIVGFVAATNGEYGAWTLWIALPMLMIGLGYLLVVNAIPLYFGSSEEHQSSGDSDESKGHQ